MNTGMKALSFLLVLIMLAVLPKTDNLQAQTIQNSSPNTKYDVHKKFDDKGNLIEYDSTSVSTWSSDSAVKITNPLINDWDENAYDPSTDTNSMDRNDRGFLGFSFNDDEFFFPQFSNPGELFRNFDNRLFIPDSDLSINPFHTDSTFFFFNSPFDEDFNARIREMQQDIEKLIQKQIDAQRRNSNHNKNIQPNTAIPDSLLMNPPDNQPNSGSTDKTIDI